MPPSSYLCPEETQGKQEDLDRGVAEKQIIEYLAAALSFRLQAFS